MLLGLGSQEVRDGGAVDVVAAALALRLEHVALALLRVEGQLAGLLAGGRGVERVDVGEGGLEVLERRVRGGGQEAVEDRGRRCGRVGRRQHLLHLFRAGDLRQDRGALDGGGALQVVPGLPGALAQVVAGPVAAAHVDDGDLEREVGQLRRRVQQLPPLALVHLGVPQHLGKGQPEDGYALRRGRDLVLEVLLVKDVALAVLGQEDDTLLPPSVSVSVGGKGLNDALRQAFRAVIVGQAGSALGDGVGEQAVLGGREVAVQERGLGREAAKGRGNGVELDLLDLRRRLGRLLVHHVVGPEEAQRQGLHVAFLLYPQVDFP